MTLLPFADISVKGVSSEMPVLEAALLPVSIGKRVTLWDDAPMPDQIEVMSETSELRWSIRAERCRHLAESLASMNDILGFYALVLDFQGSVLRDSGPVLAPERPFLDQVNCLGTERNLGRLFALVNQSGPELLAKRAKQLQESRARIDELKGVAAVSDQRPFDVDDFFRRACLQPLAEHLQLQMTAATKVAAARCPGCGGLPQLSILRPEGEGGARWLQCSFCLKEWLFRRVVCPWCGEEDKERLPRYSAEGCAYVHVSACDVCERYLKSVDMTIEGRAVPLVDEVAMASLDVWATSHGYQKIVPNLMGF